jgi:hypothetical protein
MITTESAARRPSPTRPRPASSRSLRGFDSDLGSRKSSDGSASLSCHYESIVQDGVPGVCIIAPFQIYIAGLCRDSSMYRRGISSSVRFEHLATQRCIRCRHLGSHVTVVRASRRAMKIVCDIDYYIGVLHTWRQLSTATLGVDALDISCSSPCDAGQKTAASVDASYAT